MHIFNLETSSGKILNSQLHETNCDPNQYKDTSLVFTRTSPSSLPSSERYRIRFFTSPKPPFFPIQDPEEVLPNTNPEEVLPNTGPRRSTSQYKTQKKYFPIQDPEVLQIKSKCRKKNDTVRTNSIGNIICFYQSKMWFHFKKMINSNKLEARSNIFRHRRNT